MTYRKTWFSNVLWVLYAILCVVSLVLLVGSVWTYYLAGITYGKDFNAAVITPLAGLSDNMLLLLGLIILPVTVILYWVIRGISKMIRKKCVWKERTVRVWECIIVFLALAGGVFLRVMYAEYVISMADNELFLAEKVVGMEYYDMAVVATGNIMSSTLDRISYLYVLCLQVVLSFLGNKVVSAVILQIFLQIAGMILAYAVTRKIAGRLPACVMLLYLACSFCCLRMLIYFGPEWLFFVLYMIGMLIVVSFVQSYCANRLNKFAALFGAVLIGVVISVLVYIDPPAASLVVLIVAVATGRKKRQEVTPVYNPAGVSAAVILIVVATYILVLLGALYLGLYGEKFDLHNLQIWYEYSAGFINRKPYLYDIYSIGLLIVPAAFLVFEFFRNEREQNYMLWILLCIIVAPTPMAVIGEHQYGLLSLYIWAVLAGLGLQNCIFGGRAQVTQAVIEEINSAAEKAEETKEAENLEQPKDIGKIKEIERPEGNKEPERNEEPERNKEPKRNEKPQGNKESGENRDSDVTEESRENKKLEENKEAKIINELGHNRELEETKESEEIKEAEKNKEQEEIKEQEREAKEIKMAEKTEKSGMVEAVAQQEPQKPPRYIDNPLPLPKKHVKKEMDYKYSVQEKDMKFDLEIAENDDFDIL